MTFTSSFLRNAAHGTVVSSIGARPSNPSRHPYLSIIIPVYNEEANIVPLMDRVFAVAHALPHSFEVVAIDDGSIDGSYAALQREAALRPELKVVRFRRNYGQTAAMMGGIDYATGEVIVSLDSDLQNDPADIPRLLAKLAEGYDVVSGWRVDRKDARVRRTLISRVANRIISGVSGVRLNDYGCTLKAYRSDVLTGFRLYGEMHRFIPIYASWMGARVTEIAVQHHPRRHGKSKYGLERILKVVLDMIVVKFLDRYFVKPIYLFGGAGLLSFALGVLSISGALWLKFVHGTSLIQTPLPLLSVLFILLGTISILMGLLAEILVRVYFESQQRPAYTVRDVIGGNE